MIHITWPGPGGVVNTAAVPQHTVAAGQKIILTLDGVVVVEAPLEYVIKINRRDKPLMAALGLRVVSYLGPRGEVPQPRVHARCGPGHPVAECIQPPLSPHA